MKTKLKRHFAPIAFWTLMLLFALFVTRGSHAQQNLPTAPATQTQTVNALPYLTLYSATAAVNVATTLTIPAVQGQWIYVCKLKFNLSNDNTGTVVTNVASTSTNFNSVAFKASHVVTASAGYDSPTFDFGEPGTGCAKSTSPSTAVTFVSPASVTHSAWTWYATAYYAAS